MSDEMDQYGRARFYLLHTFSHIIMKEMEFSCGYPTASLNERLYYSDQMCGVLIYTADGAEGSMGGLVWQGQPHLIHIQLIKFSCSKLFICILTSIKMIYYLKIVFSKFKWLLFMTQYNVTTSKRTFHNFYFLFLKGYSIFLSAKWKETQIGEFAPVPLLILI